VAVAKKAEREAKKARGASNLERTNSNRKLAKMMMINLEPNFQD